MDEYLKINTFTYVVNKIEWSNLKIIIVTHGVYKDGRTVQREYIFKFVFHKGFLKSILETYINILIKLHMF